MTFILKLFSLITLSAAISSCGIFGPSDAACDRSPIVDEEGNLHATEGQILMWRSGEYLYPVKVSSEQVLESNPPQLSVVILHEDEESRALVPTLLRLCEARELYSDGQIRQEDAWEDARWLGNVEEESTRVIIEGDEHTVPLSEFRLIIQLEATENE